ncbi:MAG: SoxR reducing system RseC family protein [Treponema sp.]
MKKEGIVIKLEGNYLEVVSLDNVSSNNLKGDCVNTAEKLHDCSTCSGCHTFMDKEANIIKVLNKSGKDIKIGERINYSINSFILQFFVIILLPILAFALTFFSFYHYSCNEQVSILFAFFSLFLVITLNFIFTKKLFLPFV